MKTAQRMIDAAANAAGYTIESFHGTNGDLFTVFDPSKGGAKTGADSATLGIFSTNNANVAQQYAENYGVGGALDLAFGFGPIAEARDEALKTREAVRLMRELEESKENVKRANDIVSKKAEEAVAEQIEAVSALRELIAKYDKNAAKDLVNRLVQMHWVNEELYNDKIIVDAQKLQNEAEERLSDYVAPFITARIPNKRILQLRLKIKNPKIYDAGHKTPAQFSLSDKIRDALDEGYDGVIFNNIIDPVESATHYVVFNSEQIKLASAVTKDDAGRVIPLSQRFSDQSKDIRNPYTRPDLRDRLKRKIMAGSKGGNPGQWSARKAQLLAAEYEKAGGGYTGGRSKAQRSLSKWSKQDWRTKSGRPSLETGERYLPAKAIEKLSASEYAATTRAKREATGQFSRQPKRIAEKTRRYRNPVNPQINTPEFKRWFGSSVVVDDVGIPMPVYHGTVNDFSVFDSSKVTYSMWAGFGNWFTTDRKYAEVFSKGVGKVGRVIEAYLSIQSPLIYEGDDKTNGFNRMIQEFEEVTGKKTYEATPEDAAAFREYIQSLGFDGVIITRWTGDSKLSGGRPVDIYIALESNQIKSATENRGTFDPMDPDITNPKDPRSAMTQITGTEDTYIKASKMLGGNVLDYGAGRGIGTDALRSNGLLADSFEPFPENWEGKRPPTYTDSANIPSESYDSLVSFSVINVVDPDERKFLFKEVSRILRPDGVALITGRTRQDVGAATTKIPHLEDGGYLIGKGKQQRYQKGFTQAELERYAKEVLGPGFTVETNRALNGASIKITKGKVNPAKRDNVRSKLSRIIEPDDRILCYDTASGEDFYRLWDVIHTALPMTKEALVEVEGMLDDDGVLVIESGESPAGLQDHFRKATRYNGLLLVQGPKSPEQARIETEKLRRELE